MHNPNDAVLDKIQKLILAFIVSFHPNEGTCQGQGRRKGKDEKSLAEMGHLCNEVSMFPRFAKWIWVDVALISTLQDVIKLPLGNVPSIWDWTKRGGEMISQTIKWKCYSQRTLHPSLTQQPKISKQKTRQSDSQILRNRKESSTWKLREGLKKQVLDFEVMK